MPCFAGIRRSTFTLVVIGIVATTAGACVEPTRIACPTDQGTVYCSGDAVCISGGCARQSDVEACAAKADGEACTSIASGRCVSGVCQRAFCGDGAIGFGETCDDGNNFDGDGCNAACISDETCGNGFTDRITGELCDDGNRNAGDGCSPDCKSTESCGNLTVDTAAGEQCDDGNHESGDGCSANCRSTEVCGNGFIDAQFGEQCDEGPGNSAAADALCRLDCKVKRCGDGVTDTDEACDDGNLVDGDGCAANCKSQERCGNQLVDVAAGEQCDSSLAGLAGDGCTSDCIVEADRWQVADYDQPSPRTSAAFAYDEVRNKLVMFGGQTADGFTNETWEYDGLAWERVRTPSAPSARSTAMTFDGNSGRVLMFGGGAGATIYDDTWTFDGAAWRKLTPAVSPAAASNHSLAYDSTRGVAVMLVYRSASSSNETWEFANNTWTQRATAAAPTSAENLLAYDQASSAMVAFGQGTTGTMETWKYSGTNWVQVATATTPSPRRFFGLAYDVGRSRVMLFGGANGNSIYNELWQFEGSTWALVSAGATLPAARYFHSFAYAGATGGLVTFGGFTGAITLNDTWLFGGTSWRRGDHQEPAPRHGMAMAYDKHAGTAYMFGGTTPSNTLMTETWSYRGVWRKLAPSVSPIGRRLPGMTFDEKRKRLVMFGGSGSAANRRDTWEFDGAQWHAISPATLPSARYAPMMTFDRERGVVVMFGGFTATFTPNAETWEYDGVNWTLRSPLQSPTARGGGTMVFDPRRNKTVLFGGSTGGSYVADTWEYDGTTWTEVVATTKPKARSGAAMVFHELRGTMVLSQGQGSNNQVFDDTWEFDGQTGQWRELRPFQVAPERQMTSMVFDTARGEIMSFGGLPQSGASPALTWTHAWQHPASPADSCVWARRDDDSDGLYGCGALPTDLPGTAVDETTWQPDPDCWARCTPLCAPLTTAEDPVTMRTLTWPAACAIAYPGEPYCGDGICTGWQENSQICPQDC